MAEGLSPVAALRAETDAARSALGERDVVRITRFPFNVGRESRATGLQKLKLEIELRRGQAPPLNDLFLIDRSAGGRNISREHFRIDRIGDRFVVVDRGSTCGTIVAGRSIGKNSPTSETDVLDGDIIVVGVPDSPYRLRFRIEQQA